MGSLKLAPLGAVVVLSACASSGFVSSWQAPDATPLQVAGSKVAAVVMMKDVASRRAAEDALAHELAKRGATGVALYTILPDASPDNEAAVRAALERAGVAGAVVMRPVDTKQEVVSTPAIYAGPSYGRFWGGYYGYGWGSPWSVGVVSGGEVRTNTIVSVETLVYSLKQNKLVWGGQSETTNPSSVDRLVKDTAAKAAKELQRRGLIAG
jgi:hypothetical protein